jgi:Methyltransferase domain
MMLRVLICSCVALCGAIPTVLLQPLQAPDIGCSYKVALQNEQDWSEQYSVCIWTEFSAEEAEPAITTVTSAPVCGSSSGMLALPQTFPGYYMFNAAVVIKGSGVIDFNTIVGRITRFLIIASGTRNNLPQQPLRFTARSAANRTPTCTDLYNDAESRWQRRVSSRKALVEPFDLNSPPTKFTWDPFEFEWDCSIRERVGIHLFGDGSKFMCGAEYLAQKSECLVYSIGSAYDDGFEQALLQIAPNCEVCILYILVAATHSIRTNNLFHLMHDGAQVHVFDPTSEGDTMTLRAAAFGYQYHTIGLGSQQQSDNREQLQNGPLLTLQQMMTALNHTGRTIDVFKMDCEGCEYDTLVPQVFEPMRDGTLSIGQIQLEVHLQPAGPQPLQKIVPLFNGADAAGLRIFHKERNHWGCDGYMVSLHSLDGHIAH